MNKRDVLGATTFGQRIAEDEIDTLNSYFVETEQWRKVLSGQVDVVYGPKGSGKSAIYALLQSTRTVSLSKASFSPQEKTLGALPSLKPSLQILLPAKSSSGACGSSISYP